MSASEQCEAARVGFLNDIATVPLADVVCLDESGFNTNLTRRYARSKRGRRVVGRVPKNTGKNITLICAMSSTTTLAALVIEGAVNKVVFETYVRDVLCPALRAGQVVVMDNLSSHHGERIRPLIEAVGCRVLYLPSYSPDFNPIEMLFSKLKALLRGWEVRARDLIPEAIGHALSLVASSDCLGWFRHALPCQYLRQML